MMEASASAAQHLQDPAEPEPAGRSRMEGTLQTERAAEWEGTSESSPAQMRVRAGLEPPNREREG